MFDLQSFLSGLALGLAGKPLALAEAEPTAENETDEAKE